MNQDIPKETSYGYGEKYQLNQAEAYKLRKNNQWRFRIDLAIKLLTLYALPRFKEKPAKDLIIADFGCSIGTIAIEFAKRGYQVYGIDFDPAAIKVGEKLAKESGVNVNFMCEDITDLKKTLPPIDIAVAFDIIEHLHDDELGAFLQSLKKHLSEKGCFIFHVYPTQYYYLFFGKKYLRYLLMPFKILPPSYFNRIVKAFALFIDVILLLTRGKTYGDLISKTGHCNPHTAERLGEIFKRLGYNLVFIETAEIYPFLNKSIQKQFSRQPITFRNLYGVAELKKK